jgi:hypothetical protein
MVEDLTIPSGEQILALPRFARVAFGTRCARRMIPHAIVEKPSLSPDQIQQWKDWVEIHELCAASVLDRSVNLNSKSVFPIDRELKEGLVEQIILSATQLIHDEWPIGFVRDILRDSKSILRHQGIDSILHDFHFLLERSQQENWTDETPVPQTLFGPLWPQGVPEGWPSIWDYEERTVNYVEIEYPEKEIPLGLTHYSLKKILSFRFYPAITAPLGALISDDLDDRIVGAGETFTPAFAEWKYILHEVFQNLLLKSPSEMTEEEKETWSILKQMIDVDRYLAKRPVIDHQSGTILQKEFHRTFVRWESGHQEWISVESTLDSFVTLTENTRFEAIFHRDPKTLQIRKMVYFRPLPPQKN